MRLLAKPRLTNPWTRAELIGARISFATLSSPEPCGTQKVGVIIVPTPDPRTTPSPSHAGKSTTTTTTKKRSSFLPLGGGHSSGHALAHASDPAAGQRHQSHGAARLYDVRGQQLVSAVRSRSTRTPCRHVFPPPCAHWGRWMVRAATCSFWCALPAGCWCTFSSLCDPSSLT